MLKRLLAIRGRSIPVLRRSLIVSGYLVTVVVVVGAVYLTKPLLWPGGIGIEKGETLTTERVEKDAKGISVKTTTKHDDGKTLWDWMTLLGVPVSLAILGFWLQYYQQKRADKVALDQRARDEKVEQENKARDLKIAYDLRERDEKVAREQREIAANEIKEEVLQVYFDRLSVLLVDKNLLAIASKVNATAIQEAESHPNNEATLEERELLDSAVHVIRARTLSILRRFENDAERKTSVMRFLLDAEIISKLKLSLRECDLSGAKLWNAELSGINLSLAKLSGADLSGADLSGADLHSAEMNGANLSLVNLSLANLIGAKLRSADLYETDLSGADLRTADLCGAKLHKTKLNGTKLNATKLHAVEILNGVRFSNNPGLTSRDKAHLKERGAIIEDSPVYDVPSMEN
jgi:uncharacterized protein YjbI with pentapeptide repeats